MLLRFTGKYTGKRTSITIGGVTFEGYEPSEVPAHSALVGHREFEVVETDESPVAAPRPRGRPRKV